MLYVVQYSDETWGTMTIWAITALSCLGVPIIVQLLGGWEPTSQYRVLQRLKVFWVEEVQWFASYNVWYAWWVLVGDIADQMSHESLGFRFLLAMLLSLAPCVTIILLWIPLQKQISGAGPAEASASPTIDFVRQSICKPDPPGASASGFPLRCSTSMSHCEFRLVRSELIEDIELKLASDKEAQEDTAKQPASKFEINSEVTSTQHVMRA